MSQRSFIRDAVRDSMIGWTVVAVLFCVPASAQVVVNEILQNPSAVADASGEWFELYNPGPGDVDVNGWTIADSDFDSHVINAGGPLLVPGGGYLVLGNNSDMGTNGGVDVAYSYGSSWFLSNSADEVLLLDALLVEVDRVEYDGGPLFPDPNGASMALVSPDLDNNDGGSWCASSTPFGAGDLGTPGVANDCEMGGEASEIWEIQGAGLASPFEGLVVSTVDNVVTGVGADGFFIQTPVARTDGDPETSDGIFVFMDAPPSVAVGDIVDVSGQVVEFFDLTEIGGTPTVSIDSTGNPLPAAVVFDESTPSPDQPQPDNELERFEGMLVAFSGLATGPSDRFGDVPVVAQTVRSYREMGIEYPGLPGLPVWDGNPEIFEVDPDGLGLPDVPVFANQTVVAEGPLSYSFGDYQILPSSLTLGAEPVLPQPVRDRAVGEFTVGSLNLFRLFDDVDDGGEEVVTTAEYQRRLAKFSMHIRDVLQSPEILAVQEAEKIGVLDDLAAEIQADDPTVSYTAYLEEGNDVGGIDVGFLVRDTMTVARVAQLGKSEILTFDGSLLHDRPPLVIRAAYVGGGAPVPITAMVLHNRSLSNVDDPVDGERVRQKRLEQAESVARKVQVLQNLNAPLVILGDFNAFEFTDGYVDVVGTVSGSFDPADNLLSGQDLVNPNAVNISAIFPAPEEVYSFIFNGSAQALDHVLVVRQLGPLVRDVQYGRGNVDAPASLLEDETTPLRSSDHDGLVVYFMSAAVGHAVPGARE